MTGHILPVHTVHGRVTFTDRHRHIIRMIARGATNAEMGETLSVSRETVKNQIAEICTKLDARNRAHLVALAFRYGLLRWRSDPPEYRGIDMDVESQESHVEARHTACSAEKV